MNWLSDVITSQFLWGTLLGVLLSMVSAYVALEIGRRRQRNISLLFCQDLVRNIGELSDQIEDTRKRLNLIDQESVELIDTELQIYNRNREHLVIIDQDNIRREIRDYFTKVSLSTARVRMYLRYFHQFWTDAESELDSTLKLDLQSTANRHLADSHKHCDHLREHIVTRGPKLLESLSD